MPIPSVAFTRPAVSLSGFISSLSGSALKSPLRITGTSANFHDSAEAHKLIRDDDTVVYGDSGYLGLLNKEEVLNSSHLSSIDYRINKRPSQLKTPDNYFGINWDKEIESNTKNHLYAAKRSIRY